MHVAMSNLPTQCMMVVDVKLGVDFKSFHEAENAPLKSLMNVVRRTIMLFE